MRLALFLFLIGFGIATLEAQTTPNSAANPTSAAQDIHDIRGPLPIPSTDSIYFWIAVSAAILVLLVAAWLWYRRFKKLSKLPYQIALERLEKARALMKAETAREFSIEVSEIVRSFIEERFAVRAAHQTTEEFLHELLEPSDALLARHQELLGEFLNHCDLAKFALWCLSVEEMEGMYASARTFVLEVGKPPTPSAKQQALTGPNPVKLETAKT
jgi:hypothetical protein